MNAINSLLSSVPLPLSEHGISNESVSSAEGFLSALEQESKVESRSDHIDKVANEFESVFLSLLLKEMRNTLDQQDGGLFKGEGSDTFGGMFDLFMGQHLADASPLGISDAINAYLVNLPQL